MWRLSLRVCVVESISDLSVTQIPVSYWRILYRLSFGLMLSISRVSAVSFKTFCRFLCTSP